MYNDFYDTNLISTASRVDSTWLIVSAVLAIVGGIAAYVIFVAKKNNGEYKGFLGWLHGFLNFKTFFIETILKVLYIISAIFITLGSFSLIGSSVASFFMMLLLGNVVLRVCYEFILMFLTLVSNTSEINAKLSGTRKETVKEAKETKENGKKKSNEKNSEEV